MAFQLALGTLIGQLAWRAMGIIPLLQDKNRNMYLQSLRCHWLCFMKLVEMTIPRGSTGYRLYAAAANQEAGIESRDTLHHCKQQWRIVNQIRQF